MATKGTENCEFDGRNPMNINCGEATKRNVKTNFGNYPYEKVKQSKIAYFENLRKKFGIDDLNKFAQDFITIDETENGVSFKIDKSRFNFINEVNEKLFRKNENENEIKNKKVHEGTKSPWFTLYSEVPFANFGQSLHVADLDNDGNEDLIVGAPGMFAFEKSSRAKI